MPVKNRDNMLAITIMDGVTNATDGIWVDFRVIKTFSIHIIGFAGSDAIQVRVSCEPTVLNNNTHGVQLGSTVTADRMISSASNRFRWLKIRKTVGTGASTSAHLFAEHGSS